MGSKGSDMTEVTWHSLLYSPALTFIHEYWKNHSFEYKATIFQYKLILKIELRSSALPPGNPRTVMVHAPPRHKKQKGVVHSPKVSQMHSDQNWGVRLYKTERRHRSSSGQSQIIKSRTQTFTLRIKRARDSFQIKIHCLTHHKARKMHFDRK